MRETKEAKMTLLKQVGVKLLKVCNDCGLFLDNCKGITAEVISKKGPITEQYFYYIISLPLRIIYALLRSDRVIGWI